ncbi:MAG TPA: hypothetical protein VJ673_23575 [Aromatoleum sp.]|uniref:helix-turn-helix transcriptional regulator n=1 Tax=Aromatoleum sp. TaxID=2307007 RepID=UPI002B4A1D51|nr:hypothetical protein [Aromatoleum sp.]HJV28680.1 hypothetical protein [Aromatoleum sp.]
MQQNPLPAPQLSPSELMAKPAMSWPEFLQLLGLPESTAEEAIREPDAPKFFLIGRRRYIRTADVVAWLDKQATAKPYFPRRNARRGTEQ